MASRLYIVAFQAVAITASQDLLEVTPADDKPVSLVWAKFGQHTDVGDAAEEMLRVSVIRGHTTGGSGGTAPTPRPLDRSGAAAGFAAEVNNTTKATVGTTHLLDAEDFNLRVSWQWRWTEIDEPEASQGDTTIVVRLEAAPIDSITCDGAFCIREFG